MLQPPNQPARPAAVQAQAVPPPAAASPVRSAPMQNHAHWTLDSPPAQQQPAPGAAALNSGAGLRVPDQAFASSLNSSAPSWNPVSSALPTGSASINWSFRGPQQARLLLVYRADCRRRTIACEGHRNPLCELHPVNPVSYGCQYQKLRIFLMNERNTLGTVEGGLALCMPAGLIC